VVYAHLLMKAPLGDTLCEMDLTASMYCVAQRGLFAFGSAIPGFTPWATTVPPLRGFLDLKPKLSLRGLPLPAAVEALLKLDPRRVAGETELMVDR
jgi:hypothetical protein